VLNTKSVWLISPGPVSRTVLPPIMLGVAGLPEARRRLYLDSRQNPGHLRS
jgi:hypothetical protein